MNLDLSALNRPPPTDVCPRANGPQKAVVAFCTINVDAVILHATCGVVLDISEAGVSAGEAFDADHYSGSGICVWEGKIVGTYTASGETDVDYRGAFRSLTDEEWASIREGRNPWPCPSCDGKGFVREDEK